MLTAAQIKKLGPGRHTDGGSRLILTVSENRNGRRTRRWSVRYTVKSTGKRREMSLGNADAMSLSSAREEARKAHDMASNGEDPIDVRDKRRRSQAEEASRRRTFQEVAETYIELNKPGWKNSKHAQQWSNTLAEYVYPTLGDRDVAEIDTRDVLDVLQPIWMRVPETASRVRGRIEAILSAAIVQGFRDPPNPAVWRGHLDAVLAAPKKLHQTKHHASMDWKQLPEFYGRLTKQRGIGAHAMRFLILTAARTSEVRLCTWHEMDVEHELWVLPANRMKANRAHRVPLGPEPLKLLAENFRLEEQSYVFPGRSSSGALSDGVFRALLQRMGHADITAHGFRASFKTWASERTNHAREVIEGALAHQLGDQAERAYSRGDFLEKRRRLMADWEAHCLSGVQQ